MKNGMMKCAALALVIVAGSGCSQPSDYDKVAAKALADEFCKENNAKVLRAHINPFSSDSVDVECINLATGNTFYSSITGVIKKEDR